MLHVHCTQFMTENDPWLLISLNVWIVPSAFCSNEGREKNVENSCLSCSLYECFAACKHVSMTIGHRKKMHVSVDVFFREPLHKHGNPENSHEIGWEVCISSGLRAQTVSHEGSFRLTQTRTIFCWYFLLQWKWWPSNGFSKSHRFAVLKNWFHNWRGFFISSWELNDQHGNNAV